MNLDNQNSLIELFFSQLDKQNRNSIFLQWLNPDNQKTYTWEETQTNILRSFYEFQQDQEHEYNLDNKFHLELANHFQKHTIFF